MIKRPQPGEDEEDLLRMQEEYLKAKALDSEHKPSTSFVNLRKNESTKRPITPEESGRKPSKYAQAKGLKNHVEKRPRIDVATSSVMGHILEKNLEPQPEAEPQAEHEVEDDKVYYPSVIPTMLGNIVEKNVDVEFDPDAQPMPPQGFPEAKKRDSNTDSNQKDLQPQPQKTSKINTSSMEVDNTESPEKPVLANLPSQSYMVSTGPSEEIHQENVEKLSSMSEKEILEEQQKLLQTLDPKLVEFIKSKKEKSMVVKEQATTGAVQEMEPEIELPTDIPPSDTDPLWDNDILTNPDISKWLHFDRLETDKLEWMKNIEECTKARPDKPYEARFDFTGYLLPYTMEYTEETKALFHHGDEPHRPGYTMGELIALSRSALIQQRIISINALAGMLEYYSVGIYNDVIKVPTSKLFFVIRIAMDENKAAVLEPTLRGLRNLFYQRIDEACLDALIGFEAGTYQPSLEKDKSELEELESEESDLKDYHLAEIDLLAVVIRTEILQRLYYILENIKPNLNCVQYSLQILTRLARDSIATSFRIVYTEQLMRSILNNFLPNTSINGVNNPQNPYNGKPLLAAMKLLRVICLQCKEVTKLLLSKYDVLSSISTYISSPVDTVYGMRIQIEAYCALTNLLCYGHGAVAALSLLPVVITTLYKHVQGTDIFVTSSAISSMHGAVVIQLLNKLLASRTVGIEQYKSQIYPLLKEGTEKWIKQVAQSDSYTCAHLRVVCSAIDCSRTIVSLENMPLDFFNNTLKELSSSSGFKAMMNNLIPCSNLVSTVGKEDVFSIYNLTTLNCCVVDSPQKVLPILKVESPMPFMVSLIKLLSFVKDKAITEGFLRQLRPYLKAFADQVPALCDNWFTKMELDFIFYILKIASEIDVAEPEKDLLYAVATKLSYILKKDKSDQLRFIFEKILFNKAWFTAERMLNLVNISDPEGFSKALMSIGDIKKCYSSLISGKYVDTGPNMVLNKWREQILPRDWIYYPIMKLYANSQELAVKAKPNAGVANKEDAQKDSVNQFIIRCSLEWILFNELCFPDLLEDLDPTDRFCRLMCVFLCHNSLFLESSIKVVLEKCLRCLFRKREEFNFEKEVVGLQNFQDFYTQSVEQFQAVSYGDHTFAACVLLPLAQRHNVKWRKLVWSEYAGCLRALDCPEDLLCYDLNDYLYPEETDESLIRSYHQAIVSNLVRPDTLSYKIAQHHVECYRKRKELESVS